LQACLYSWENKVPLIAFTKDRCLTLFDNPLVDSLHTVYHEPKVPYRQLFILCYRYRVEASSFV
jgi:hypothetical protein